MLQAELFDVYLLLTQNLYRVALPGAELCCYSILQLVQCFSQKGNQIEAKSFDPANRSSIDLICYC